MASIDSMLPTFQPLISLLKEEARQNIHAILVTFSVLQSERSPAKALAPKNMSSMSVTDEVSQAQIWPLKDVARLNIWRMSITCDTFQRFRLWLKTVASSLLDSPRNISLMTTALLTSHKSNGSSKAAEAVPRKD